MVIFRVKVEFEVFASPEPVYRSAAKNIDYTETLERAKV